MRRPHTDSLVPAPPHDHPFSFHDVVSPRLLQVAFALTFVCAMGLLVLGGSTVAPLSLLSGTFYSVEQLSPTFRAVSHLNPFFYVISGFRHGFLSEADSPIWIGAVGLLVLNALLFVACYLVLRSGWKIKN